MGDAGHWSWKESMLFPISLRDNELVRYVWYYPCIQGDVIFVMPTKGRRTYG
jgi:hypothetical protein